MGINAQDLLDCVIRPTLTQINLGGTTAEALMLGTAAVESDMGSRLRQQNGSALGIYQIELRTAEEICGKYHNLTQPLRNEHRSMADNLVGDLFFATAIARLEYVRSAAPLAEDADVDLLAAYWKLHYNSARGKGQIRAFLYSHAEHIAGKVKF